MNRRELLGLGVAGALGALVWGCTRAEVSGPPSLRLGRDECAECGMIISEDRCSSALLVERAGGREHVLFDDIGCMLDYEHENTDLRVVGGFVHDYVTRQWTGSAAAAYLFAPEANLGTPMGSGMVAFSSREGAAKAKESSGGEVLDYAGLAAARRAWMEAKYGARKGPP